VRRSSSCAHQLGREPLEVPGVLDDPVLQASGVPRDEKRDAAADEEHFETGLPHAPAHNRVDFGDFRLPFIRRGPIQVADPFGDPDDDLALGNHAAAQDRARLDRPPTAVPRQQRQHRVPVVLELDLQVVEGRAFA
jgi:hypothetical protein